MNNDLIQRAIATFSQVAGPNRLSFTDEEIEHYVNMVLPLCSGLGQDDFK